MNVRRDHDFYIDHLLRIRDKHWQELIDLRRQIQDLNYRTNSHENFIVVLFTAFWVLLLFGSWWLHASK
jgi:hypothetical protein